MIHMRAFNPFEVRNLTFLTQKNIEYTLVQITETGYKKSILDATDPMRQYFKEKGMHDYASQRQGQEDKVLQNTLILDEVTAYSTTTSLYRPETKKGDPRLWTNTLKKHCIPNDILLLFYQHNNLYLVNLTHIDIEKAYSSPIITPLKDILSSAHNEAMSIANELTGLREFGIRKNL